MLSTASATFKAGFARCWLRSLRGEQSHAGQRDPAAVGSSGPGLGFSRGWCSDIRSAMFLPLLFTPECFG